MKLRCVNDQCVDYEKDEYFSNLKYKYDAERREFLAPEQICGKCGNIRINPESEVPLSEKYIKVLKIPSMTKSQKTAMLKKRSHEHYKKNIEESAKDKLGRAMKEMRGK